MGPILWKLKWYYKTPTPTRFGLTGSTSGSIKLYKRVWYNCVLPDDVLVTPETLKCWCFIIVL